MDEIKALPFPLFPMRVLHVYQSYISQTVGGLELAIEQIALATAGPSRNPQVYFLGQESGRTQVSGVTEIRAKKWFTVWSMAVPTPRAWWALGRAIAEADIVHYHVPWPIADLAHLFFRPRGPTVVTYHADLVRQKRIEPLYALLRNAFFRRVDRIVVTTPSYGESSVALQRFLSKTISIPLCLQDMSIGASQDGRAGKPYFLFVGVLRYYKGLNTLLTAAKQVQCEIKIVGDGPEMAHLRQRVESEAIANVTLCGRVSDAEKRVLMQNCEALILPSNSRAEAFGMVLLEAMRAGRPTITTDIDSGMRYVCMDGVTGITVAPDAPEALAAAMSTLLEDQNLSARLGKGARERFVSHFSAAAVGKQYLDLYEQIQTERI
jgi:glycosyltransferase involved in cell wall biosynthesis